MARVVVTGANRGIGLSFVRRFVARGDEVIAACRRVSPELEALGVATIPLDVMDDESVASLAERVEGAVDVLVNNAGILLRDRLEALDLDGIRRQFEVNSLGPLKVTAALASKIPTGGKVAIVTSRMGSIADNTSGRMYGYRMSKAAVNMAGMSLAHDLRDAGVAVVLLHPGFVTTGMTGGRGNWGPDEAVAGLVERIDALTLETTGSFFHANGDALPW